MSDINTVTLTGRLGGDIETRTVGQNETTVGEVSLAVDCGFGDKRKTIWLRLVFWGKSAESAAKYLEKGRKIAINGRLDQDEWEDKETGKKRNATRIVVNEWTFAGDGKGEAKQEKRETSETQGNAPADDIPF